MYIYTYTHTQGSGRIRARAQLFRSGDNCAVVPNVDNVVAHTAGDDGTAVQAPHSGRPINSRR